MTMIQIPDALYRSLQRMAQLMRHPVEEVVTRALESSVPPLPENLPEAMRADLLTLENLSDDDLWRVARGAVSEAHARRHGELLAKNRAGTPSVEEQAELAQLRTQADQLMLRKAYAYALLKWRGHRLPALAELDAAA